jgi:hypothetical protein
MARTNYDSYLGTKGVCGYRNWILTEETYKTNLLASPLICNIYREQNFFFLSVSRTELGEHSTCQLRGTERNVFLGWAYTPAATSLLWWTGPLLHLRA